MKIKKFFVGTFLLMFLLLFKWRVKAENLFPVNPILGYSLLQSRKMQKMIQNTSIPSADGSKKECVTRWYGSYFKKF